MLKREKFPRERRNENPVPWIKQLRLRIAGRDPQCANVRLAARIGPAGRSAVQARVQLNGTGVPARAKAELASGADPSTRLHGTTFRQAKVVDGWTEEWAGTQARELYRTTFRQSYVGRGGQGRGRAGALAVRHRTGPPRPRRQPRRYWPWPPAPRQQPGAIGRGRRHHASNSGALGLGHRYHSFNTPQRMLQHVHAAGE
jgi:hypothetical protein